MTMTGAEVSVDTEAFSGSEFSANPYGEFKDEQPTWIETVAEDVYIQIKNPSEHYVGAVFGTMAGGKTEVVRQVTGRLKEEDYPIKIYGFGYDKRGKDEKEIFARGTEVDASSNGHPKLERDMDAFNIDDIISDLEDSVKANNIPKAIFVSEAAFLFNEDQERNGFLELDRLIEIAAAHNIKILFDSLGIMFNGDPVPFMQKLLLHESLTHAKLMQGYDSPTESYMAQQNIRVVALDRQTGTILNTDNEDARQRGKSVDPAYYEEMSQDQRMILAEALQQVQQLSFIRGQKLDGINLDAFPNIQPEDIVWIPAGLSDEKVAMGSERYFPMTTEQMRILYQAIGQIEKAKKLRGVDEPGFYDDPYGKIHQWQQAA